MSFDADAAASDEDFWQSFSRKYKTKLLQAGWKGSLQVDGLEDPENHDVLGNVLFDAVHKDGKQVRFDEAEAEQDIPGGGGSDFASIKKTLRSLLCHGILHECRPLLLRKRGR